jgi:hypothetical protein
LRVATCCMSKRKKLNVHAQALGALGGRARMKKLSAQERCELASKAGTARAKKLSAKARKAIAKLAVAAREQKRRAESKAHGK